LNATGPRISRRDRNNVVRALLPFLSDVTSHAGSKGITAVSLVLAGAVVEGIGILLLIPFISLISGSAQAGAMPMFAGRFFRFASVETRAGKLELLVSVFVVLMIARGVVIAMRDITVAQLGIDYVRSIRTRLTRKLAAAEWSVITHLHHGRVVQLLSTEPSRLNSATVLVFRDLVTLIMLGSQIGIAIYLSPPLALFAVTAVALGTLTLSPALNRARRYGERTTQANFAIINDMGRFLGALKLALAQNLQSVFVREFESTLRSLGVEQIAFLRRQTIARLAVTTVASLVGAVALLVGIIVLHLSASVLITLLVIFSRMNGPATQLHTDSQLLVQALPAYETIRSLERELETRSSAVPAPVSAQPLQPIPFRAIEFLGVTFVHRFEAGADERGGVRNLNLVIEPGTILGVSGASGAGKTTFADLLVGLYQPQQGTITVGNAELRGAVLPVWRNAISYVPQDPFLFHESIRQNLLWANPDAAEDLLWDALDRAAIADFVRSSPDGLDTIVGERGTLLSGGERQRIALARALLRKPRLLILDEATNAIDVGNEKAILTRLIADPAHPTIIVIAHRRETLALCQRLIVLEHGVLVADGPPAPVLDGLAPIESDASPPARSVQA